MGASDKTEYSHSGAVSQTGTGFRVSGAYAPWPRHSWSGETAI